MPLRESRHAPHPDSSGPPRCLGPHLLHVLAEHDRLGAETAGHEVRTVRVADLDFPLLRSLQAWTEERMPASLDADDCRKWFTRLEKLGAKAE